MQFKVKGILSYPHLFTARSVQQGDEPKFSASILVLKNDPQIPAILHLIETEKANGFPNGFPSTGKSFLKDGALGDDPALKDYYIISGNAKADSRPHLVDANMNPVMDQSQAYAGAVVWAAFNTFTYSMAVNKGVGAGLNGVMLTGEEGALGRLDGKPTVESMFGGVASAPAPAAPAPAAQYLMTDAANGLTREQYHASGWTDELLIQNGMMIAPSFA